MFQLLLYGRHVIECRKQTNENKNWKFSTHLLHTYIHYILGYLFLQLFLIFRLEKFLCFEIIIKAPCENFKSFEKTFTLANTSFLKTPNRNVWDSKNITLEFYDKVFYKWRIITQTQSEQLKTSSKKFFGGIYIYYLFMPIHRHIKNII